MLVALVVDLLKPCITLYVHSQKEYILLKQLTNLSIFIITLSKHVAVYAYFTFLAYLEHTISSSRALLEFRSGAHQIAKYPPLNHRMLDNQKVSHPSD